MGKITFTFTEGGVDYDCDNVTGEDVLKAFMILAHNLKEHDAPDDLIMAVARTGIDETAFNSIMSGDESATN